MATAIELSSRALDLRNQVVPPQSVRHTPVVEIANILGYRVNEFTPTPHNQSVSGAVDHQQRVIFVNANESPARKRFTIAHEIGHICFHANEGNTVDHRHQLGYHPDAAPKEREANVFAGELLMPRMPFEAMWQAYGGNVSSIADHFQVSEPAARVRARELNLER